MRLVDAVDLLVGGTCCELWESRDDLPTSRSAPHVGRWVELLQEVELMYARVWECIKRAQPRRERPRTRCYEFRHDIT